MDLQKPVNDILFFAGEHCSYKYPDTVAGAYLSGLQAAGDIEDMNKRWPDIKIDMPYLASTSMLENERKREQQYTPGVTPRHKAIARKKARERFLREQIGLHNFKYNSYDMYIHNEYKDAVLQKDQVVQVSSSLLEETKKSLLDGTIWNQDIVPITNDASSSSELEELSQVFFFFFVIYFFYKKKKYDLIADIKNKRRIYELDNTIDKDSNDDTELSPINSSRRKDKEKKKDLTSKPRHSKSSSGKHQHQHHRHHHHDKHHSKHRHGTIAGSSSGHHSRTRSKDSKEHKMKSQNMHKGKGNEKTHDNSKNGSKDHDWLNPQKTGHPNLEMTETDKNVLKKAKEEISKYVRKYLSKQSIFSNKENCDKDMYKTIAKKVTNKVYKDYQSHYQNEDSKERAKFTVDMFMTSKRKKAVVGLIEKYIEREKSSK
ncbi:PHD zinc finger-containing protein [Reticulomyxa filosa]|uniref:PHD zinc finger-containing protein n=1 Tax=Reticulomyxa filosa TaxID=46433 RepID=X6PBW4_RETFI|nr:PHD zinc finger-containing protein [Reticulomyxa filosa]|eukprot:ETO35995.1 PHD zinc finger-containing protein [Reticulomyxa filosa]